MNESFRTVHEWIGTQGLKTDIIFSGKIFQVYAVYIFENILPLKHPLIGDPKSI